MTHAVPVTALGDWLAGELRGSARDTVVLGGHYAIFSAGAAASDLLADGDTVPAAAREMLAFTHLSWQATCTAARLEPDAAFRVAVLVDDIQFVRPVLADRSAAERLGAALARGYLESHPHLAPYHAAAVSGGVLHADRIVRASGEHWIFSERLLRQQAVARVRRDAVGRDDTRVRVTATDNGNTVTVTTPDHGDYCLVQSGHATCAGGYVELLAQLAAQGAKRLIALVPMRCLGQVATGTRLTRDLGLGPGLSVVNVAIPDPASGAAAIIDRE